MQQAELWLASLIAVVHRGGEGGGEERGGGGGGGSFVPRCYCLGRIDTFEGGEGLQSVLANATCVCVCV